MSLLSVVIPAYNEGAMIHKTAEVVSSLLSENNIEYEIIFVNDGSKDTTWEEIVNASANNKNIKGVFPVTLERKAQYLQVLNMQAVIVV